MFERVQEYYKMAPAYLGYMVTTSIDTIISGA